MISYHNNAFYQSALKKAREKTERIKREKTSLTANHLEEKSRAENSEVSRSMLKFFQNIEMRKGEQGYTGDTGYTPVKGVDYFDGIDGYTPKKGVDYTDGKDGYTPKKGIDYVDGKDGYTPKFHRGKNPPDNVHDLWIRD